MVKLLDIRINRLMKTICCKSFGSTVRFDFESSVVIYIDERKHNIVIYDIYY